MRLILLFLIIVSIPSNAKDGILEFDIQKK